MKLPAQGGQQSGSTHIVATHTPSSDDVSLKTSMVTLFGPNGSVKRVRCLLDTASHRTYLTTEVAEFLGLVPTGTERLNVSGYGGGYVASNMKRFAVGVGRQDGERPDCQLEGLATPKICEPLPKPSVEDWLDRIDQSVTPLADDPREIQGDLWTGRIDLLIGADQYWEVLTGDSLRLSPRLMLLDSIFGWFIHGVTGHRDSNDNTTMALLIHANPIEQDKPADLLARLFDLDGAADGPSDANLLESDPAMIRFNSTIQKIGKRYQVGLAWKEDHRPLPTNESAATAQLLRQLRRLKRQPELLAQYNQQIQDYLSGGFAEAIEEEKPLPGAKVHYIPHLAVARPDKESTKLRVVFNASFGDPSLNDCLHPGPNLVPPMTEILLRCRSHKFALTADIEKAFLQIHLSTSDKDSVRFLWVDDPFSDLPQIRKLRWIGVVFGVTCSPFLLAATLHHHLDYHIANSSSSTAALMKRDFFVDDLISGADTPEEAEQIAKEAILIAADAGFPLRRWRTNDRDLQFNLDQLSPQKAPAGNLEFD